MKIEEQNTFARLVGRSAFILAIASAAFIVPGVVRTKLSAVYFGEQGIALFGQLSQLQTLLISVGAAGLVTATRVVLARPEYSPERAARLQSWCLWCPFLATLVLSASLAAFGTSLSSLLLGSPSFGGETAFASFGIPFAVAGQIAIAGAQAQGSRWVLVGAAGGSAVVGSCAVWLCMGTENQVLGSISFAAAPAVQLLFVLAACPPVRKALRYRPWISRKILSEVFVIAWASALLGICASAAELLSRTLVVHFHGLSAIAAYQPVATLVTQLVSLALSALAMASLIELSRVKDPVRLGSIISKLERQFVPLIGMVCAGLLSASPFLVALFFNDSLWESAYPLMAVSLAFEPVRAAVWLAGSAFLPNGMRMAWLLNGLLAVATQVSMVALLSPFIGALSLSIGFACANVLSLVVTLVILRRNKIVVGWLALLRPSVIAALILLSSIWSSQLLGLVVAGPLVCSVLIGMTVGIGRLRRGRSATVRRREAF